MDRIDKALKALKKGEFILLHDSNKRENETDLVIAAEFVTSENVERMRLEAGGLICVALEKELWGKVGLPFMTDIQNLAREKFPVLNSLTPDDIPYDEKSSFSITINHRKTFTGITDEDRALTIREVGKFFQKAGENLQKEFGRNFRSPGHVPLLLSSGLENREGHTELATALLELADLTPVAAICEMLDSESHKALSKEKALQYSRERKMVFLDAKEVKERYLSSGSDNL